MKRKRAVGYASLSEDVCRVGINHREMAPIAAGDFSGYSRLVRRDDKYCCRETIKRVRAQPQATGSQYVRLRSADLWQQNGELYK